jgi:3-isopropylmalate dehydrogenase
LENEAQSIEKAVSLVLAQGYRTADIADGGDSISCRQMTEKIIAAIA